MLILITFIFLLSSFVWVYEIYMFQWESYRKECPIDRNESLGEHLINRGNERYLSVIIFVSVILGCMVGYIQRNCKKFRTTLFRANYIALANYTMIFALIFSP